MYSNLVLCITFAVALASPDGYNSLVGSASSRNPAVLVPILTDDRQAPDAFGAYSFTVETGDGIRRQEQGAPQGPSGAVAQSGSWSFTLPDGTPAVFNYVADENGFRVESDLLPTPPPLPQHAIEQIEMARRQDAAAAASGVRPSYTAPSVPVRPSASASRPSTQYAAPSASRPSTQYAAPSASRPSAQYAAPSASRPSPQYATPSASRPSAQYAAPSASRPSAQYAAPSASRPSAQYVAPSASRPSAQYAAPSAPAPQIARPPAPAPQYSAPRPSASSNRPSRPSNQYGAPSAPATQVTRAPAPAPQYSAPRASASANRPSRLSAPSSLFRPAAPSSNYGPPQ